MLGDKPSVQRFITQFVERRLKQNGGVRFIPVGNDKAFKKQQIELGFTKSKKNSGPKSPEQPQTNANQKPNQRCECQSFKHGLVGNCLTCGRVICKQEGWPCLFCGNTEKQNKQRGQVKDVEQARKLAQRLVKFDRTSERRTQVFDDQEDYFNTDNTWVDPETRKLLVAKEKEWEQQKKDAKRKVQLNFDFAGRAVAVTEQVAAPQRPSLPELKKETKKQKDDSQNGPAVEDKSSYPSISVLANPTLDGPAPVWQEAALRRLNEKKEGESEGSKASERGRRERVQHQYFGIEEEAAGQQQARLPQNFILGVWESGAGSLRAGLAGRLPNWVLTSHGPYDGQDPSPESVKEAVASYSVLVSHTLDNCRFSQAEVDLLSAGLARLVELGVKGVIFQLPAASAQLDPAAADSKGNPGKIFGLTIASLVQRFPSLSFAVQPHKASGEIPTDRAALEHLTDLRTTLPGPVPLVWVLGLQEVLTLAEFEKLQTFFHPHPLLIRHTYPKQLPGPAGHFMYPYQALDGSVVPLLAGLLLDIPRPGGQDTLMLFETVRQLVCQPDSYTPEVAFKSAALRLFGDEKAAEDFVEMAVLTPPGRGVSTALQKKQLQEADTVEQHLRSVRWLLERFAKSQPDFVYFCEFVEGFLVSRTKFAH